MEMPSLQDGSVDAHSTVGPWAHGGVEEEESAVMAGIIPLAGALDLTRFMSSTERNIWSKRNPIWRANRILKPRQPMNNELGEDWSSKYRPTSFQKVLGDCHSEIVHAIKLIVEKKNLRHVVITGPPGTGRRSMAEVLVHEYFGYEAAQSCVLRLSMKKVNASYADMKPLFDRFMDSLGGKRVASRPYSAVIIENFDEIAPAAQTNVIKFMEDLTRCTRFIFPVTSLKDVPDKIKKGGNTMLVTQPPSPRLAVDVLFRICQTERVGFERAGFQELWKDCKGDLTRCITTMQKTFLRHHYASLENVCKVLYPTHKEEKVLVSAFASLQPLERCPTCTLVPPCIHIREEHLLKQALVRREALPHYHNALVCRTFAKTGACALFNREGHCSLDHPKNIHILQYPPSRCPVCTLPRPCGYCKYDKVRCAAMAMVDSCRARITELLQKMESGPYGFIPPLKLTNLKEEAKQKLQALQTRRKSLEENKSIEVADFYAHLEELSKEINDYLLKLVEDEIDDPATHPIYHIDPPLGLPRDSMSVAASAKTSKTVSSTRTGSRSNKSRSPKSKSSKSPRSK